MSIQLCHLFRDDFTKDAAWRAVRWCMERGADDFTLAKIVCAGSDLEPLKPFDNAAAANKKPNAARRDLEADEQSRELWLLTDETIAALHLAFPLGIFDYDPRPSAWFEDLTIYRRGEVMLGIITHEGEGVLRVTAAETESFHSAGFITRAKGEWAGYAPSAI